MTDRNKHRLITLLIVIVWIVNGLVCKVLNFVPRHEQIVARILSNSHSRTLILLIGLSEIVMAIWIVTKIKSKVNAVAQIVIVVVMNILEFILVPDLLLWGRLNSFFALLFFIIVYYNEFVLNHRINLGERK